MNKIRLDLDALAVETFATTKDDGAERGTVRGQGSGLGCGTDGGPLDPSISADGECICDNRFSPAETGGCY